MAERKPRVWTVFVMLGITNLALLVAGVIAFVAFAVSSVRSTPGHPPRMREVIPQALSTPSFFILITSMSVAVFLIASLSGAALSPMRLVERLRLRPARLRFVDYLLVVIAFLGLSESLSAAIHLMGWDDTGALRQMSDTFSKMHGGTLVVGIVLVGLGAGLAEELFFRGYVQTRLAERWGTTLAIALTSLAFGIAHFDLIQGPFAFAIGLFLGWITVRTRSVVPAIAAHVANNAASVAASALLPHLSARGTAVLLAVAFVVGFSATTRLDRTLPT